MMRNLEIQKSESLRVIKARVLISHAVAFCAFFTPVNKTLLAWTVGTFFLRTFIWEAASHRYFAHRSYKTSRAFQFLLAVAAACGAQRGPLWWSWHHRQHHRHADTEQDLHSPVKQGFWYAHIGWFLQEKNIHTDLSKVQDLAKYPELVWVNKYHYLFPYLLMMCIYFVGDCSSIFGKETTGWSAVVWVFFVSTVLSLHSTFSVNTFTHGRKLGLFHYRNYQTRDTTSNNWLLCVFTMGASWHNNHHRYMNSARAGFFWWEIDLTYIILRILAMLGLVWDLRTVPKQVIHEARNKKAEETIL